jgi:hypothetical protein
MANPSATLRAGVTINQQALNSFVAGLANQFGEAVGDTVPFVQSLTPVDTKRLYNSTRATDPIVSGKVVQCDIVAGGISLYGEIREQEIRRDVDYAYWVEIKNPYIRSNLPAIGNGIIANLMERRRANA